MARRRVITCDQCGEPIPTLSEWLDVRSTMAVFYDTNLRLDFCSRDCLVTWGEEHKP